MMYLSRNEMYNSRKQKPPLPVQALALDAMPDSVDLAVLISFEETQIEGEPDLVIELIDLYLKDASDKLVAIRKAMAAMDETSLRRVAHNLKGSSASLGAHRMAALCEELEHLVGDHSLHKAGSLVRRLEQELHLVRQVFTAERQRRL